MKIDKFPWGSMIWHMNDAERQTTSTTLATMTIASHSTTELHSHYNADEIILCQTGKLCIAIGNKNHNLTEGEHIVILRGTKHQILNLSSTQSSATIVYNHPNRNYLT